MPGNPEERKPEGEKGPKPSSSASNPPPGDAIDFSSVESLSLFDWMERAAKEAGLGSGGVKVSIQEHEATTASKLAIGLLCIFGSCLLITIPASVAFLYAVISRVVWDAKFPLKEVTDSVQLFTVYFSAIGTLFSPLLAFVLGYYFSKRDTGNHPNHTDSGT